LVSPQAEGTRGADVFGSIPLFKGFGEDELQAIANSSKTVSFKPGEAIVKEGDAGLGAYVIVEGRALVKRRGKTLATLKKGSFFGEMSLFDNQPRSVDVIAEEPTVCFVLLRWNFWALINKNKKMVQVLLQEMAQRLRATDEALSE
jgi:CRP-like cAMP-binding protein